ncbi:hypothetical protein AJ78_06370 [Emergomyces pasteurianus Ep9510]|uniref:Uncharacterized protein n=1 Tax=Emergomyces pasteurianus Ep9510 TaxID=1447872 RepID=A0A1J9PZ34_9EURO|nr:hypothetical protein AJ78_06370 [Emergomyces pasteurianus Ep9510]
MAFREPLPCKISEEHYPGNGEEIVRSEAAIYPDQQELPRAAIPENAPQRRTAFLEPGYLLIDWIEAENSQMLSNTFSRPHTEAH